MYVRLTFITSITDKIEEANKLYYEEIAPVVKQQKGNIDVYLLTSADDPHESISFSSWESKEEAMAYEASGLYKELVGKAAHTFAKPPVLKTYNT